MDEQQLRLEAAASDDDMAGGRVGRLRGGDARAEEDALDWLENHQPSNASGRRRFPFMLWATRSAAALVLALRHAG